MTEAVDPAAARLATVLELAARLLPGERYVLLLENVRLFRELGNLFLELHPTATDDQAARYVAAMAELSFAAAHFRRPRQVPRGTRA